MVPEMVPELVPELVPEFGLLGAPKGSKLHPDLGGKTGPNLGAHFGNGKISREFP